MIHLDPNGGRNLKMYSFRHAVRVETDNNWSRQVSTLFRDPLPTHVEHVGDNVHGSWFKITLPASVWALAVNSERGTSVGVYHSPAVLEFELRKALNADSKKTKA
jgi:hypothetical protein